MHKQNGNPNERCAITVSLSNQWYSEPWACKTREMFSNFLGSSALAPGKSFDPIFEFVSISIAFYKHFNVIQRTSSDASTASNKKSKVCKTFSDNFAVIFIPYVSLYPAEITIFL